MQKFIRKVLNDYKEYFVLIIFLIISLVFLPLNNNQKLKKIKTYAFSSFAYLDNTADNFFALFVNNTELNKLRQENAELNLRNNLLRNYALENSELHRLLNFKNQSSFELIPSKIISKTVSKTHTNFIINSGVNDGVTVGMPIVSGEGLVGIIDQVDDNFSVVKTIKSPDLMISVEDQRSNYSGILSWNGESLFLKNVPSSSDIKEGDRIVSSAFGTLFPPMISVGVVSKNEQNIPGLLSIVYIKSFVDLSEIKNIFVVKVVVSKKLRNVELNFRRDLQ